VGVTFGHLGGRHDGPFWWRGLGPACKVERQLSVVWVSDTWVVESLTSSARPRVWLVDAVVEVGGSGGAGGGS
jgi:hypothetical protein